MTRNGFAALQDKCEAGETVEPSLSSGKTLVGDSPVRYLDRAFCARNRKHRTLACFPGAGIGDVGLRVFWWGRMSHPLSALVRVGTL